MAQLVKNTPANAREVGSVLSGEDPWRRKWQATLVILPGELHGQRSLAGYSPWGLKESDTTESTTECTCMHTHTHTHTIFY